MKIGEIKILLSNCVTGIYLRWWFNGWHYFNFIDGVEVKMITENLDTQVSRFFSVISKIERPTRIKSKFNYEVTIEGISPGDIAAFVGLLMAEKVEQYDCGVWYEVEIKRGTHTIREAREPAHILRFEIDREELPNSSSTVKKALRLYLNETLCDIDEDEVVPINKQINDIAEMQDRQSDFTASFRIRKTRAMRSLFELSGEVGATTQFPYQQQTVKLIQDNIEIITDGILVLDDVDDQYYYVSVLSGNLSFFKAIEGKSITDLTLTDANHTWNIADIAASHAGDLDYVYPLCEPSDDAGLGILTDDGTDISFWIGHLRPFIKVKAIWDEIFSEAQYLYEGDIFDSDLFNRLHIPISSLIPTKGLTDRYLYSVWWTGSVTTAFGATLVGFAGAALIKGDETFRGGRYYAPFDGTYTIQFGFFGTVVPGVVPLAELYVNGASVVSMEMLVFGLIGGTRQGEVTVSAGDYIEVYTTQPCTFNYYSVLILSIDSPRISAGSPIEAAAHLPNISQTDFIKNICNMFGLLPDATPRDRRVNFWSYKELYDNVPIARDWSAFLSERDDRVGFKFGDYAQNNFLRYKDSDDVILDTGVGIMQIDDFTLPENKEVILLSLSTCDEVLLLTDVPVSRINFNKYDAGAVDNPYTVNDTVDARIVSIRLTSETSPPEEKSMWLRATYTGVDDTEIENPKRSVSMEVSFSGLVINYAYLSRLLTKTNLRRAKFNLPVHEVAMMKHDLPIYLNQYKAYFYVNKINNFVPGKLCTIDLIKL